MWEGQGHSTRELTACSLAPPGWLRAQACSLIALLRQGPQEAHSAGRRNRQREGLPGGKARDKETGCPPSCCQRVLGGGGRSELEYWGIGICVPPTPRQDLTSGLLREDNPSVPVVRHTFLPLLVVTQLCSETSPSPPTTCTRARQDTGRKTTFIYLEENTHEALHTCR